jgi:protein required for attachment to host cells
MKLDSKTWVVVADGAKYIILENTGTRARIDLAVLDHAETETPPTRDQASDRPGRMADAGSSGFSAMEETDWHMLQKERFAKSLTEQLNNWAAQDRFAHLVLVAAPRTLGEMRPDYSTALKTRLVREIPKDATNLTRADIEKLLDAA